MKQLLILRHAQALSTETGGSDKTRKLSPQGIEDAKALGKAMSKDGLKPELVLCSAATRTRQTFDHVAESLEGYKTEYVEALYNSTYETLLSALRDAPNAVDSILIVAHNPGIHTLAARLAEDDGSQQAEKLVMAYMPATLTVLECDIDDWATLEPYENSIKAVYETVEYNSSDRPTRWM